MKFSEIPSPSGSLSSGDLQKRIVESYFMLRVGIGVIGVAFPLILLFGGLLIHICPQDSMSAYYHAMNPHGAAMRNWFVGLLFMVSISLGLYRGFSVFEDLLLDVAAIFGIGIAIFPMPWDPAKAKCGAGNSVLAPGITFGWLSLHGLCAFVFFISIAFVCWFCADDTLSLIRDRARRNRLKITYRAIAILMPVSMASAWILLNTVLRTTWAVFWVEALGIFAFGAYWLVKSIELSDTAADKKAVKGQLRQHNGQVEEVAAG